MRCNTYIDINKIGKIIFKNIATCMEEIFGSLKIPLKKLSIPTKNYII
jgi:hypothetical protein